MATIVQTIGWIMMVVALTALLILFGWGAWGLAVAVVIGVGLQAIAVYEKAEASRR